MFGCLNFLFYPVDIPGVFLFTTTGKHSNSSTSEASVLSIFDLGSTSLFFWLICLVFGPRPVCHLCLFPILFSSILALLLLDSAPGTDCRLQFSLELGRQFVRIR